MVKKKKADRPAGAMVDTGLPCDLFEDCGSSDAMSVYYHEEDDTYSAFCFSCKHSSYNYSYDKSSKPKQYKRRESNMSEDFNLDPLPSFQEIKNNNIAVDSKERRVRAEFYDVFGIKHEIAGDGVTIDKVYYPIHKKGEHTGYVVRERYPIGHPKEGKLKYFHRKIGETDGNCQLIGQELFSPDKYKRIVINEGAEDLVSALAMLSRKSKHEDPLMIPFALVSVPHGANVRVIKDNYEYLSGFEEIYILADADKQGQEFITACTKVLPVGKVKIVSLPEQYCDTSEMWKDARTEIRMASAVDSFWNCLWGAKKYSPAGIYGLSEGWKQYLERGTEDLIPFPDSFGDINARTYGGYGLGEIINLAAASSVGKSIFVKEMIYKALHETDYKIGVCSFEENFGEFIEGLLSIHMSTQLNEIPYDMRDRKAEWKAFKELMQIGRKDITIDEEGNHEQEPEQDRIKYLDHQGSLDGVELLDKINFLIRGCGCNIIIIDPVTLALANSGLEEDEYTSEMVKIVKRENIALINVHHVRKNAGGQTANSEGADLSEEMIKGSGSHFQTGMLNLLMMRNKVHENDIIKNTTKLKMSKCRRHGKSTGIVGYTYYNGSTGRLELGRSPEEILEEQDGQSDDGGFPTE